MVRVGARVERVDLFLPQTCDCGAAPLSLARPSRARRDRDRVWAWAARAMRPTHVRSLALALLAASVACGPVPSAESPAVAPSTKHGTYNHSEHAKHGAKHASFEAKHGAEAKLPKAKEASVDRSSKAPKAPGKSHKDEASKAATESQAEGAGDAPAASSSTSPEPAAAATASSSALGGAGMPLLCVSLIAIAACYNYQSDITAFVAGLSGWGQQLGAFFVLVHR